MIASKSKPTTIWDFIGDLDFDFEELKRRYDIERDRRLNDAIPGERLVTSFGTARFFDHALS